MFDGETKRHLADRGISQGWRCLEVGGGGGSIASWLAERVGPTGSVLATDIDPRHLGETKHTNLEIRQHDIVHDPLPEALFDLVHARLVLMHVPERERALARIVKALKPGGWLVDEEFDSVSVPPDPALGEVLLKTQIALSRLLGDYGAERRLGRLLVGRLRAHGLTGIGAEARMTMWQDGSSGALFMRAAYMQVRPAIIEAGYVTHQQFDEDMVALDAPGFMMPSPLMWTAWGRRP
jgi:SAM-dependent methyltransferase